MGDVATEDKAQVQLRQRVAGQLAQAGQSSNDVLAGRVVDMARSLRGEVAFVGALGALFGRDKVPRQVASAILDEVERVPPPSTSRSTGAQGNESDGSQAARAAPTRAGLSTGSGEKHVFVARSSGSGASSSKQRPSEEAPARKKIKVDSALDLAASLDGEDEGSGEQGLNAAQFKVPARPAAKTHARLKGSETPSHPGGLSDTARQRLEEYKQKRAARQAQAATTTNTTTSKDDEHPRLGQDTFNEFKDRLNRDIRQRPESTSKPPPPESESRSNPAPDRRRPWLDATPRENGRASGLDPRSRGSSGSNGARQGARDSAPGARSWDATPRSVRGGGQSWDATPRSVRGGQSWDATPRSVRGGGQSWDATPQPRSARREKDEDGRLTLAGRNWEPDDDEKQAIDRDWYGAEEAGGVVGDDDHNPFADYAEAEAQAQAQAQVQQKARLSARQLQRKQEVDDWEEDRLRVSGVGARRAIDLDHSMNDESESQVHLLVHDLRPPFLDGKTVFTRQLEPVNPVRDPTSDMAVFSRKGSRLVRERREQKERQRAAAKAAALAGTALGNIMGVKSEEEQEEQQQKGEGGGKEEYSHKSESQFASHLKKDKGGGSAFSRGKTLKEQRQYLPAFACRDELMAMIRENQVVVVVGETGSGKTTQLTQFLHEDGYTRNGLIGCTQPRRVAAMSVAKRVSEEMDVELGSTVGYSIRFEDCTSSSTAIKYMTDGVLLRESLNEGDLDRYSAIILDEAHERSLSTDVLMGLLKKILARRRDLRLIVTSATMNADKFAAFYGGAPTFTIPGRTFPVDVLFSKAPCDDYVESAVKQALSIHLTHGAGDILVFMTGQEDIETTCDVIAERLTQLDDEATPPLLVLPIYSQMPADLQAKIFNPTEHGERKCVVATNIAETSLTVDGIMYVVDAGYSKLKVYNPRVGMDSLQITPISRANANQRAGRAGRTGPGSAYRLYTETAFQEELFENGIPEIQRTNLANTVLLLKSLGVKDLLEFDFMDPPPQDNLLTSMFQLWVLGALDNVGDLTLVGKRMSEFPMEPSLSKMLIASASPEYGCSAEVLSIVAMLSVPSVFYRPRERQDEADAAREKFYVAESDHLTLLHCYTQWRTNGYRDAWCNAHFLHAKVLRKAREVRTQLEDICNTLKLPIVSCGTDWDTVRKCVAAGFFHQAARAKGIGEYANARTGVPLQLHPTSSVSGAGVQPAFVVFHEVIATAKTYMHTVTAVDPHWLAELGGVFFSVRERDVSGARSRLGQRDAEFSKRREIEMAFVRDKEQERRRDEALRRKEEASTPRMAMPGSATPRRGRRF
ncbi:P-loop containing nucleoside triphosphate hydrolase protein [Acaromyces ingoldii]|uniref:Pre-mRNA-splicing factor ATP-dependent RNA helicase PRP16 n=1 Tax=Acaromyces ingoldii TaxID=215250 RepID=A0A316YJS1_9BASI|nr:P-loop containing nucleoside triphosphate hydrolase protein [Acaromyces ingoldii]PWN89800.1 P-loop containing nucleoside triphosphate hydrolase protein [Acaromyces ingoldii]